MRVAIRSSAKGWTVTAASGWDTGVFGVRIGVRHLSTALDIKETLKRLPAGDERNAAIDALILGEAVRDARAEFARVMEAR